MIGALDIGGTKIAAGLVDEDGRVLARLERPTEADRGWQDGLRRITTMIQEARDQAGGDLKGIGIGCTGPVYPQTGLIGKVEFLTGWEGVHIVQDLSQAFGVPVALENDADAAALGEWGWGAGKGTDSFILVTVGTGIGAGLVLGGKLYRGVNGSHPEIGHQVIDPSGPACYCGAHGCWESLASGPAMERRAQADHPGRELHSARQLCDAALQDDVLAQEAVQRTGRYLGLGLANLVNLFSPEMIALGGGLMQSYPLFQDEIATAIRTHCTQVPYQDVRILPASLGAQTGLAGAARAWYNRFSP